MLLRFELHALGRPYHAARVRLGPREGDSAPHGHADFHELMAIESGRGDHLLPGGRVPLEPGQVVLVRPRDRHAIAGRGDGLDFVNVAFPSPLWHGFCDLAGIDPGRWERATEPPVFERADRPEVAAAFETALERFRAGPDRVDLLRLWTELLARELPADGPDLPAGPPAWLASACRAMQPEVNLRAGVPRLVELARVSPAHLARSMRAHYGVTPTAFVTGLRLERAAALLAGGAEPVTVIAARCGFASQSYFTRCFTAAHGIPPRAFRQAAQRPFVP
jgi:AraC-like DNA-binding protein/mannose-6-phosphate isomerase-like protein (cupin superfamily)